MGLVSRTLGGGLQNGWLVINKVPLENGSALGPGSSDSLTHNEYMKGSWLCSSRGCLSSLEGCVCVTSPSCLRKGQRQSL